MIFAAGLGTRLKPLTYNKPKALVEINGKTLLERCILNLKKNGISDIVVNVHHFADLMIEYLNNNPFEGVTIHISDERNELLDTGGGLLKTKDLFGKEEPILLINVDILTNLSIQELLDFHSTNNSLATLVIRKRNGSRFLLFNQENVLCGWINESTGEEKISRPDEFYTADKFGFSGIQIINPELLDMIEEHGKFSIIDLYLRLAKTHSIKGFIDEQSIWMDLGKYSQIEEAKKLVEEFDALEG